MKRASCFTVIVVCGLAGTALDADFKPRLAVRTDIGGDPDDQQSMIRLMVFAPKFRVYDISDQDGIADWMRTGFPGLKDGFDPRTTVSRWRPDFQREFATRMAWCLPVKP